MSDIPLERSAVGVSTRRVGTRLPARVIVALICWLVIAIMAWPLIMSFLASLKPQAEVTAIPPDYLPHSLSLQSYLTVYEYQAGLPTYLFNSSMVAFLTILFCLALAVPAGYGLARFHVPFKEVLFLLLLASMMIPYQALLTPLFLMFTKLGLTNNHVGLAIIHTILQLPFSVYVMRNAFEGIPRELEEAAIVDGCSPLQILGRVFMPLAVPGMVTVALFAFIMSWNEFLAALIFMSKETSFTLPVLLTSVIGSFYGSVAWGPLQAGVMVSVIPCIAIYFLLQRHYVSGFLSGAVK
ncbi:carbohydrate ABC transporter permease [Chelativorans salis]|uniref:sn-glycerol-3-phosphate transport system permease protein UgpE n=1 Tax=Chelativorans salis TaxID=2978478 RepID=A0ABT2LSZ4_9HYPH|nr:carbohydrate ABC transporter permease [Chelativorans sp. EGI FJ00035]MCT7377647.1 carbohydrate ABC transporter permease [Chelativorans sp. EGI FJ00035]